MNNLDSVGRFTPDSIEISRTAARRHEHLSALDHSHGSTSSARPSWWPGSWLSATTLAGTFARPVRTA